VPEIEEIKATWDSAGGWSAGGDEWSGPWGGTEPLWRGTLLPRIGRFLPTGTALEIGPGQGRWTQFLKDLCDELVLVDVAPHCIEACRRRFADAQNLSFHVGDGRSFPTVADAALDFAFSFDSLVHAEADVLGAYARELARTLKPDGVAFLHHSNMGAYSRAARLARRVPDRLRRRLTMRGVLVNVYAWRAESTTAELFAGLCERAGLACIGQELIAWEYGHQLTDVLSLVTPRGSRWERERVVVENPAFMDEARAVARTAPLYSAAATPRNSST
jgi:SAM-dependent methyltransferase